MVSWHPALVLEIAPNYTYRDAAPVWTAIQLECLANEGFNIERNRDRGLDKIETGTLQFSILNVEGDWNPQGSWFGTNLIRCPVRVSAVYASVTYYLFYGYVERWEVIPDQERPRIDVFCSDAGKLLNRWPLTASYASELSSVRVTNVLDDVSWPAGLRDIETGLETVQASTLTDANALEHLRTVTETEFGRLFQAANGDLTFHNRHHSSTSPFNAVQGTFGGPSGLPLVGLKIPYDDKNLWNYIQVTRAGGSTQTAQDTTSQLTYGMAALSPRTGLLMTTDAAALNQASWLLYRWKDPEMEIDSIHLRGRDSATLWAQILGREVGDRIRVIQTMVAADDIDEEVIIESVSHRITDKGAVWDTSWRGSPARFWEMWELETSLLDVSTILGY